MLSWSRVDSSGLWPSVLEAWGCVETTRGRVEVSKRISFDEFSVVLKLGATVG